MIGLLLLGSGVALSGTVRYEYDKLGRVVRVERPDGILITYSYDAASNIENRTITEDRDYDGFIDSEDNCPDHVNDQSDVDGDSFGDACDCAPGDDGIYRGAPQECDGVNTDCDDNWPAIPADEADVDVDGLAICEGDCDDTNPDVYPGAWQVCDGVNNDCDQPEWPTLHPWTASMITLSADGAYRAGL